MLIFNVIFWFYNNGYCASCFWRAKRHGFISTRAVCNVGYLLYLLARLQQHPLRSAVSIQLSGGIMRSASVPLFMMLEFIMSAVGDTFEISVKTKDVIGMLCLRSRCSPEELLLLCSISP